MVVLMFVVEHQHCASGCSFRCKKLQAKTHRYPGYLPVSYICFHSLSNSQAFLLMFQEACKYYKKLNVIDFNFIVVAGCKRK